MEHSISEYAKQMAIKMYRKGELTVVEISNLVDISVGVLYKIFRECREQGILTARMGTNAERQKFTADQEQEIAIDYYENDMTPKELNAKWNIHPMQLQRIRNKYKEIYGRKPNSNKYLKEKSRQQLNNNT